MTASVKTTVKTRRQQQRQLLTNCNRDDDGNQNRYAAATVKATMVATSLLYLFLNVCSVVFFSVLSQIPQQKTVTHVTARETTSKHLCKICEIHLASTSSTNIHSWLRIFNFLEIFVN